MLQNVNLKKCIQFTKSDIFPYTDTDMKVIYSLQVSVILFGGGGEGGSIQVASCRDLTPSIQWGTPLYSGTPYSTPFLTSIRFIEFIMMSHTK